MFNRPKDDRTSQHSTIKTNKTSPPPLREYLLDSATIHHFREVNISVIPLTLWKLLRRKWKINFELEHFHTKR